MIRGLVYLRYAYDVSDEKDYISASELGEYLYCRHAYYLKKNGAKRELSRELLAGQREHRELVREVKKVEQAQTRQGVGFKLAALLFGLAILLYVIGQLL